MPVTKHYYKNGEITVIWQPELCKHSGICFGGLPRVFNPRKRPWIEIDKADSMTIMNQVKKCPGRALSFFTNEENKEGL